MEERRKKNRRCSDLCSLHSGVDKTQEHHEKMISALFKRLWTIVLLLLGNLLLVLLQYVIKPF